MEIRQADINDAEQIIALVNARWELIFKRTKNRVESRHLPGRKQILDRISNGEEFIAIQGEKIIGVITISNENLAYVGVEWGMKDSSPIYIDWLLVDPSVKESNLEKDLMVFAEQMARKKGAKSIRLDEFVTKQSQEFYLNLGYKKVGEIAVNKIGTKAICYEKIL